MVDNAPNARMRSPYPNVRAEGARWVFLPVVVRYESSGTTFEIDRTEFETDVSFGVPGVTITDNDVGDFTLTVPEATRVFPLGVPVPYLATPPSGAGGVATLFSCSALTANSIRFVLMEQQADDQLFDVSDGAADNDRFFIGLMAEVG